MQVFGVLFGVVLLFLLAYWGYPVLLVAPVCAIIVAAFNGMPLLETFTDTFMRGAGNSFTTLFGVLVLGGILAELYKVSGGATAIAKSLLRGSRKIFRAEGSVVAPILVIVVIGMVLCYGGINGVVGLVIMFPISLEIMKANDLPRELAPGIIMGATCTAAMTMPGSPQSQNVIPSLYLGTSSTAGLIPGLAGGLVTLALVVLFMTSAAKKARAQGIGYTDPPSMPVQQRPENELPNALVSTVPLVLVFVCYNLLHWDINIALSVGDVLCIALFWKQLGGLKGVPVHLGTGAADSCSLGAIVCFLSGFGAVVSATPAFTAICQTVVNIPGPVTFKAFLAMAIVVGVAGSGPAGLMAGVPMFAETFGQLGLSMAAFHRIAAFTGTCLDTLPSNAGVNVASRLSGYSVKVTYRYCFLTTVLSTTIGAVVVTVILTIAPGLA